MNSFNPEPTATAASSASRSHLLGRIWRLRWLARTLAGRTNHMFWKKKPNNEHLVPHQKECNKMASAALNASGHITLY